jgi:hypothetical protein
VSGYNEELSSIQWVSEPLVTRFLTAYLLAEQTIDMGRVTWLLRHSLAATIDMSAAYSGAAFEVLRTGYYNDPERVPRTRLIPKTEWQKIVGSLIATLDQAPNVLSTEQRASFEEKLRGLNSKSGTKLNEQFLGDIGLPCDDVELQALAARNNAAHGNKIEENEWNYWSAASAALWTLTSRAVFAVLDVEVPAYIDYGSSGAERFPARPLRDRQSLRINKPGA